MHRIHLEVKAVRATTRHPNDFDEMYYLEQIQGEIERLLTGRQFFKIELKVWPEEDRAKT